MRSHVETQGKSANATIDNANENRLHKDAQYGKKSTTTNLKITCTSTQSMIVYETGRHVLSKLIQGSYTCNKCT